MTDATPTSQAGSTGDDFGLPAPDRFQEIPSAPIRPYAGQVVLAWGDDGVTFPGIVRSVHDVDQGLVAVVPLVPGAASPSGADLYPVMGVLEGMPKAGLGTVHWRPTVDAELVRLELGRSINAAAIAELQTWSNRVEERLGALERKAGLAGFQVHVDEALSQTPTQLEASDEVMRRAFKDAEPQKMEAGPLLIASDPPGGVGHRNDFERITWTGWALRAEIARAYLAGAAEPADLKEGATTRAAMVYARARVNEVVASCGEGGS